MAHIAVASTSSVLSMLPSSARTVAIGLAVTLLASQLANNPAAAAEGSLPSAITSMSTADIDGAAPADDPSRIARWEALREAIFGKRKIQDGSAVIGLDAPSRALDAALVPLGLTILNSKTAGAKPVKAIYLVIDNNPSPLAGHIIFGPAADPSSLKLRVRINEYTLIHAVAESSDGSLYGVEKFVKAAGGCSAPAGADETEALQQMGRMKLKVLGDFAPGKPLQAQLLIRHPNFNGMQMNQITRMYTPARFIRTLEVSYSGTPVLHMDSDISMSSDPAITFGFVPKQKGELEIIAIDSEDSNFSQRFDIPAPAAPSAAGTTPTPASQVEEPKDFWLGPVNAPTPSTLHGATVIRAPDVAAIVKNQRAVVIDVSNTPERPQKLAPQAVWLPPPHPVIPGSLWLAGAGSGTIDADTEQMYKARLAQATGNDLDRPVVVYCHERCWLSWNAAKRAIRYGYRNVYWFPDGIEGWRAAGYATSTAAPATVSSSARS
jgi:sulfur-oxidizing protein SoxY